ncbi:MAG: hypothetical protein WA753_19005 [Pseudolabrys sp.]
MRHTKDVGPARLRLSWSVDLLGGTAPARSHVTTLLLYSWIKERTGSEERFAFTTRSAAT